jgi:gas vesicle protein
MKNSANIFLGILGAATAGVVIGMLIAPEKGEDLRGKLKGTASDFAKRLGDLITQGKERFDDVKGKAMEEAEAYKDDIKSEATQAYRKAKASV